MATLANMLECSGWSFEKAEQIALGKIIAGEKDVILDLQLLYVAQGKNDLAEQLEIEADRILPMSPERYFNKAWKYMKSNNLYEGMRCLYISRQRRLFGSPSPRTKTEEWDGSSLEGKKILLCSEGGLGDEIINVRFAKNFKEMGAKVIVSCNTGLMNLFDSVNEVNTVVDSRVVDMVKHDFWIPAMSAPFFLKTSFENLSGEPYIKPIKNRAWDYIVKKNKFNIGIRWAGNPKFEHEQLRKFPVEPLFDLANISGVQLYSLQRDNDMLKLPENIIDLAPLIETWDDTSAVLEKMDLIISSCTSVAHLAAAMGKETWIIIPIMPYYLWSVPGSTSKWYNSVKLFRQIQFGNWEQPFEKVKMELEERMK